jgi:hypothetical protein
MHTDIPDADARSNREYELPPCTLESTYLGARADPEHECDSEIPLRKALDADSVLAGYSSRESPPSSCYGLQHQQRLPCGLMLSLTDGRTTPTGSEITKGQLDASRIQKSRVVSPTNGMCGNLSVSTSANRFDSGQAGNPEY